MKKLMLLGGSHFLLPLIKKAQDMGIYVITVDFIPSNVAHQYSNEYYNISILDKKAVLELAENLKIDGIMSFATDPGVLTAAFVCEQLGLPAAGPYESIEILQDKIKFREFLQKNGFRVPYAKGYNSTQELLKDAEKLNFPVIVKPSDSAGSKGVTKVESRRTLEAAFLNAMNYSFKKSVIVEEFIITKGFSSDSDGFSLNGEFSFISYSSQHFDPNSSNLYVPVGMTYPSSFEKHNIKNLNNELNRLIKILKMGSSLYNIETRIDKNGYEYIMELSPRGGGNRLSEMVKLNFNVDLIESAIKAALGEQLNAFSPKETSIYFCELILHSHQSGKFINLEINNEFEPNIFEIDVWVSTNDEVTKFSAANHAIGTLIMQFSSFEESQNFIMKHDEYVRVIVK